MNLARCFLLLLTVCVPVSISAETRLVLDFPLHVGRFGDGCFYVQEGQFKDGLNQFCFDGQTHSKTRGELFTGGHPSLRDAKPLPPKDAIRVLARWRATLDDYFGSKELIRIERNPIDLKSIPKAKLEELGNDPEFIIRIQAQLLLQRIQEYEMLHPKAGDK